MSREQFRDTFLPLNMVDDGRVYYWYISDGKWKVVEEGKVEEYRVPYERYDLKAVTRGSDELLYYSDLVGLGTSIYTMPRASYALLYNKDLDAEGCSWVVEHTSNRQLDVKVKQLDTGGFSWDGEHTSERQLDAKVKPRTWGSEPIMYDFSSELECSYKIPVSYMTNPKYVEHFEQMLAIHEIYYTKNQDYGDAFTELIDEYGPISALVRMSDKMSRLKNLLNTDDGYVLYESVDDTLIDLANYAIMTALHLRRKAERDKHTDD